MVAKIIKLTFGELFSIFRRKINYNKDINPELSKKVQGLDLLDDNKYHDFTYFIKGIKKTETNQCIENIKNLCLNYENWFRNKISKPWCKKGYLKILDIFFVK